jgi:hypothetical protein
VPAAFISSSLRGVVNVRLLRTLCPICREAIATGDEARGAFQAIESMLAPGEGTLRFAARGCNECYNSGYAGRTGAFEVMPCSDPIRDLILRGRSPRQIRARAINEGVQTLRQTALLKAAQGHTTLDEVRRCIPQEPAVMLKSASGSSSARMQSTRSIGSDGRRGIVTIGSDRTPEVDGSSLRAAERAIKNPET